MTSQKISIFKPHPPLSKSGCAPVCNQTIWGDAVKILGGRKLPLVQHPWVSEKTPNFTSE